MNDKSKKKDYRESDKYIIKWVKGYTELKERLVEIEDKMPEYEIFNICSDRGAKLVSPYFTIILRKKD